MNTHVLCLVAPRKVSQEMLLKMVWTFGVINKNPRPASKQSMKVFLGEGDALSLKTLNEAVR